VAKNADGRQLSESPADDMTLRFFVKTVLYRTVPFIFERYRLAHRQRRIVEPSLSMIDDNAWQSQESTRVRAYTTYEEYIRHQSSKFAGMLARKGGFSGRIIAKNRLMFRRHFLLATPFLSPNVKIVCAAARDGTEVEVWRDLGFKDAIGFDLYPGPNNQFVIAGDFHKMPLDAGSVDLLYCNSLDHALDLDKFFHEASRVLKPGALALIDLTDQETGAGPWEATEWARAQDVLDIALKRFSAIVSTQQDGIWKSTLLRN
jgi:SAM-dependent methyltransferase